jgi:tellurite resistance protein TehA-like permease
MLPDGRGEVGVRAAPAVRGIDPGSFAIVMATGIVSAALRLAGGPAVSAALLVIATACFALLVAASALRAAAFPADLRDDLASPQTAFSGFAFVAACGVLGDRLATDGHDGTAAALAAAALVAWLALTWVVPGRMAVRYRTPPAVTDIGGNWYLWAVGTQSLAIAATFLWTGGILGAQPAAITAITAWLAGAALYLLISALVVARLLIAGLRQDSPTAPYWVAMGAASITVLAAALILHDAGSPAVRAARTALTGAAVGFWILACSLIPLLLGRVAWRHLLRREPVRYREDLWMIVFPAGMYATASLQLGSAARLPLIHAVGTAAAWAAACVWAMTFAAMIAWLAARLRSFMSGYDRSCGGGAGHAGRAG